MNSPTITSRLTQVDHSCYTCLSQESMNIYFFEFIESSQDDFIRRARLTIELG